MTDVKGPPPKRKPVDLVTYLRFTAEVNLPGTGPMTSWTRSKDATKVELADSPRPGRVRLWRLLEVGGVRVRDGNFTDVPLTSISYESGMDPEAADAFEALKQQAVAAADVARKAAAPAPQDDDEEDDE